MHVILHSDMNCFYASVELMLAPHLRGKPLIVCGETEERHGIVLAKSQEAKILGIKTGMSNYEARSLCPDLVMVPPHYDLYVKYSHLAREIYKRYTNLVEPFGMDECWLDVSQSGVFGDGLKIAEEIRQTIKQELGLTVSVGVSWNKIFAKFGSDYKKPDAVTAITPENYKRIVWPLPIGDLLYCGPASTRKLNGYGVHTIGELAQRPDEFLKALLGKNGVMLRHFAAGLDQSPVRPCNETVPVYSIGKGITCTEDLKTIDEVGRVLVELAQDVGMRMREYHAFASGIEVGVRGSGLSFISYRERLETPICSSAFIADAGIRLFDRKWPWTDCVRALSIRGTDLIPDSSYRPQSLFVGDRVDFEKQERVEKAVDLIRRMYGKAAIRPASSLMRLKMPSDGRDEVTLPGRMYMDTQ